MYFYLILTFSFFLMGTFGMFFSKKHIILMLMCMELLLFSVNINFVILSVFLDDLLGQVYSMLLLTISASESAVGLAILIVYNSLSGGMSIDLINLLKT